MTAEHLLLATRMGCFRLNQPVFVGIDEDVQQPAGYTLPRVLCRPRSTAGRGGGWA